MTVLTPEQKHPRAVRDMFARIAGRYDLMNRLMTGGRDRVWRRRVVELAALPPEGRLLDLGTGTGAIVFEALRRTPNALVMGADFTLEMMRLGQESSRGGDLSPHPSPPPQGRRGPILSPVKGEGQGGDDSAPPPQLSPTRGEGAYSMPAWVAADALRLPFPDNTFDAVTSGFLMRNIPDIEAGFAEQWRVVRPGGRVVCLDTSPPPDNALHPFIDFYMRRVIPVLGRLITGQADAYRYLPASTLAFLTPEALRAIMERVGLREVRYERWMLGTITILVGVK